MLFNLEYDSGDVIEGYVVPDGFSDVAAIRVFDGKREILSMECDGMRDAVVTSGRHATGLIGFRLDESNIPQIKKRTGLAIHDRKTGLLVFRRKPSQSRIDKKVLRLETQLVPFTKIDRALERYFQYNVRQVERFGHETALQAFHLNGIQSIYISGRLLLRNYEEFLDKGFEVAGLINDPYLEMAERLLVFKRFAKLPPNAFGERDRMILSPAVQHFENVDLASPASVNQALKTVDDHVRRIIASPLARQLTSTHPDAVPTRQSLAPAMDAISRFSVIGLKSHPETFTEPLAEFLGIGSVELPEPLIHVVASNLADLLRQLPRSERLLEFDLILYHFVREAILRHQDVRATAHRLPGI